jgi:hypothetical protein
MSASINKDPSDLRVTTAEPTEFDRYWAKPIEEIQDKTDLVVIHVCDESRNVTRDFCCRRKILVEHMKYFESFLSETDSGFDDIDISVHCDVDIFEWLMAYIHFSSSPPAMDKGIVISILISSEFLQIEALVDSCISYIADNLTDIIRLPIDLSCISDKLLTKLAQHTPAQVCICFKY